MCDLTKAKAATASRADAANGGSLELVELNLASLASVRACADALVANGEPFDLVICNAASWRMRSGKTADGFEMQMHEPSRPIVLVNRIASLMKPGSAARQSVVSRPSKFGRRSRRSEFRAHAL